MAREFLCYRCKKNISGSAYEVWTYVGFRPSKIKTYTSQGYRYGQKEYRFGQQEVVCHSCSHKYFQKYQDDRRWEHAYHHADGEVEYIY